MLKKSEKSPLNIFRPMLQNMVLLKSHNKHYQIFNLNPTSQSNLLLLCHYSFIKITYYTESIISRQESMYMLVNKNCNTSHVSLFLLTSQPTAELHSWISNFLYLALNLNRNLKSSSSLLFGEFTNVIKYSAGLHLISINLFYRSLYEIISLKYVVNKN